MDPFDFTEGFCGWNGDPASSNDEEYRSKLSYADELRSMFQDVQITNKAKPASNTRPKSTSCMSSSVKTRKRKTVPSTAPKTARVSSSKQMSKTMRAEHSSNFYDRKVTSMKHTLHRTPSNLYIRDTAKKKKSNVTATAVKTLPTAAVDLNLNLAEKNTETPPVFSEFEPFPRFDRRNKGAENKKHVQATTQQETDNTTKSNVHQSLSADQIEDSLLNAPQQQHHQSADDAFLTPATSMVSLHEKNSKGHKKNIAKPKNRRKLKSEINQITRMYKKNRVKAPPATITAIPIKCFDATVPVLQTYHTSNRKKKRIRGKPPSTSISSTTSQVVSEELSLSECFQDQESGTTSQELVVNESMSEPQEDEFSISDIERFHDEMIRQQPSMVAYNQEDKNTANAKMEDVSLEQRLQRIIARWESTEKLKSRRSSRSRARRGF